MSIRIGTEGIGEIFIGTESIGEVYAGTELVWQKAIVAPPTEQPSFGNGLATLGSNSLTITNGALTTNVFGSHFPGRGGVNPNAGDAASISLYSFSGTSGVNGEGIFTDNVSFVSVPAIPTLVNTPSFGFGSIAGYVFTVPASPANQVYEITATTPEGNTGIYELVVGNPTTFETPVTITTTGTASWFGFATVINNGGVDGFPDAYTTANPQIGVLGPSTSGTQADLVVHADLTDFDLVSITSTAELSVGAGGFADNVIIRGVPSDLGTGNIAVTVDQAVANSGPPVGNITFATVNTATNEYVVNFNITSIGGGAITQIDVLTVPTGTVVADASPLPASFLSIGSHTYSFTSTDINDPFAIGLRFTNLEGSNDTITAPATEI